MRPMSVSGADHSGPRATINSRSSTTRYQRAVVLAAAIAAYVPVSSAWVERFYSTRAYPPLQRAITSASNALPFAALDALIAIAIVAWLTCAWRDARRSGGRLRTIATIAWRSIVWSAGAYLVFLATWGLNYQRRHLPEKLPYDASAVTQPAALAAARAAVDRANGLYAGAHASGWPAPDAADPDLATAFARALRDVRLPASVAVARPKRSIADWYFR